MRKEDLTPIRTCPQFPTPVQHSWILASHQELVYLLTSRGNVGVLMCIINLHMSSEPDHAPPPGYNLLQEVGIPQLYQDIRTRSRSNPGHSSGGRQGNLE